MQPEQPPISSIDYLNSIATPTPQKTMNPLVLWLFIGGLLAVVAVVIMLVMSGGTGSKDTLAVVSLRFSSLSSLAKDSQENIQSSDLRTLNSSLTLALADASQGISQFVTADATNEKSKAAQTVAAEIADLQAQLEEARLNAMYDRTYAREVTYYLKDIRTQLNVIFQKTSDEELVAYLKKTNANLKPIEDSFANFNEG